MADECGHTAIVDHLRFESESAEQMESDSETTADPEGDQPKEETEAESKKSIEVEETQSEEVVPPTPVYKQYKSAFPWRRIRKSKLV